MRLTWRVCLSKMAPMGCMIRKIRLMAWMLGTLVLPVLLSPSCSAPLVPPARMPKQSRSALPDEVLLESLRQDWIALHTVRMPEEQRNAVILRYNANLQILIRRYRVDIKRHPKGVPPAFPEQVELVSDVPLHELYDDIVPAADIHFDTLEEHYTVPGVGVPVVGIIPATKTGKLKQLHAINSRGTVRTLTAVLEFPENGGKPRLHLIPRNRQETLRIGRLEYPLAGDFSAALELYWDLTQIDDNRILGLLRPQELRDVTGLSCIEGYDPEKIPVILTHGLLSSAGTFNNLVNRLMNDPEIRRNYQFWYFNYPTGVAWTITAADYRRAINQLRDEVDPRHTNRNWDNMVVVGHSMGGLITHYSQCTEPWLLLKDVSSLGGIQPYLNGYYVDHPFQSGAVGEMEGMREDYFFRPVEAGMVIYLATPHKGAPLARYRIVSLLMRFVELPQGIIDEAIHIATLQENNIIVNPRRLTEWFTSVNQLSPDSYSIRGLQGLQIRNVPTYSVIGTQGCSPLEESTDGVVPYWSSHIPWGGQKVVPWGHSVQDAPETAEYIRGLLLDYLPKAGRKRSKR